MAPSLSHWDTLLHNGRPLYTHLPVDFPWTTGQPPNAILGRSPGKFACFMFYLNVLKMFVKIVFVMSKIFKIFIYLFLQKKAQNNFFAFTIKII